MCVKKIAQRQHKYCLEKQCRSRKKKHFNMTLFNKGIEQYERMTAICDFYFEN